MSKLIDLAGALLAQTDREKAMATLTEQVADNKMQFENDKYNAGKAVTAAEKALAALASNPKATARQIIDATDAVAVAKREVEQITSIMESRF